MQRGKGRFNLLSKMLRSNKVKENLVKILKQVTVQMKTNRFRIRQTIHNKSNSSAQSLPGVIKMV